WLAAESAHSCRVREYQSHSALSGRTEHVLAQWIIEHGRLRNLLIVQRPAAPGIWIERTIGIGLDGHAHQCIVGDAEFVHVALELQGKELCGECKACLTIPIA